LAALAVGFFDLAYLAFGLPLGLPAVAPPVDPLAVANEAIRFLDSGLNQNSLAATGWCLIHSISSSPQHDARRGFFDHFIKNVLKNTNDTRLLRFDFFHFSAWKEAISAQPR
jgi:hypothetical protein